MNSLDSLIRLYSDNLGWPARLGTPAYFAAHWLLMRGLVLAFQLRSLQIEWIGLVVIALYASIYVLLLHRRRSLTLAPLPIPHADGDALARAEGPRPTTGVAGGWTRVAATGPPPAGTRHRVDVPTPAGTTTLTHAHRRSSPSPSPRLSGCSPPRVGRHPHPPGHPRRLLDPRIGPLRPGPRPVTS